MSTGSMAAIDPQQSSELTVRTKAGWQTRQMALDRNDRESYVKLTVREMIVYGVFLVIFVASCSGLYSYATFVVNREVSTLFVDSGFTTSANDEDDEDDVTIKFNDIITMEHFWKYFHNVLCDRLYEVSVQTGKENGSEILQENKFLFRPRARQVRVEEGHCEIRNQFKGLFRECYVPYEIRYEDKSSFGPKQGTQWTYSDDSATQGVGYEGEIAYYGAGGYYFDFPKNKEDARALIQDLEYNTWLNRGTRAVFVDFAIYNCNINVVCAVKLVFEFPASGGIVPSYSFRTVKLYRFAVADTMLSFVGLCAVVVFIAYFTFEEILEISYFRLRYFTKFWNNVDFSILLFGWCSLWLALVIALKEQPSSKLVDTMSASEGYKAVEYLVARHELLVQLMAYMFFLVCIKVIKYTDLNRSMTIIYLSVGRCFKIVAGYLVIMAIVVTAFAVLGYCAFGSQVKGFSTVNDSLLSALRILMRDFDFRSLETVDQVFTTFFFVLFTCMVIFVLLTMLVAIVFHAYFDVDVEELLAERKVYVCDKISEFVYRVLLPRVGLKDWSAKRQNDRLKSKLDEHITYQDVYKTLKRCRYTDSQVEDILEKYGIQPQNGVHEDEARQMFQDVLQNQPGTSNEDREKNTSNPSDVEWLVKRTNELQSSLDEVHKKIDIVIARLDAIRVHVPRNYAEQAQEESSQ